LESCAEALDVIRRRTGQSSGSPQTDAVDVEIEHVVQVQVSVHDEERLLLRAPLHDFSVRLSRDIMTEMLKANAYGQATGAARLALDPDDDRPVLLMLLAVKPLDEASLIGSVIDFMNHAAYWQTVGTDDLEALRENARRPSISPDQWNDVVLVRV
jgi:hypothetical protein